MSTNEQHEVLFNQLVAMFHFAALQQMGKLKNPMTDKIERDLQQAQISIDMLDMLHAKMNGNLSAGEEKMFAGVLQELRLNYVDEASKPTTLEAAAPPAESTAKP